MTWVISPFYGISLLQGGGLKNKRNKVSQKRKNARNNGLL
ncbi:hypothetical protein XCR1_1110003 [Xenorhabdus cabanillasii JM26]|uniref:Uncharacterized protein n=1 Tax=Xenorhabdus cabanillasii JM26 TaxID=1427517 RepID=W1IQ29_9GAMM|nr:hypothetical protein XCR1_1110003 [Xenorhabdus cabanillasii JM26]